MRTDGVNTFDVVDLRRLAIAKAKAYQEKTGESWAWPNFLHVQLNISAHLDDVPCARTGRDASCQCYVWDKGKQVYVPAGTHGKHQCPVKLASMEKAA